MIALAALKGITFAAGGLKIIAVVVGIVAVMGFGFSGCWQMLNSGYISAEADRLEDIGKQNAISAARLTRDNASSRAAEQRYRRERDDALKAEKEAREARKTKVIEKGMICTPGCTYSQ